MMSNAEQRSACLHTITVTNRERIHLGGIEEVVSYDEISVVMITSMGTLTLEGEGFNIEKLDLDNKEVTLAGKLCGLYYMEQRSAKRGLFSGMRR